MRLIRHARVAALAAAGSLVLAACGGGDATDTGSAGTGGGELAGEIIVDGSSTVAPLTEPVAALFQQENPGVRVSVGTSGTGGGFEKFCRAETDVSNASREIKESEIQACESAGIRYEEIAVANDALSVVVNPANPVNCMSPEQLSTFVYGPDATAASWSEIEGLDAPFGEPLQIFSPGADSGTFDYFTDAVNGEEGASRSQGVNIVGEDDNATVTGVAGSPGGIGYFGFSFFAENQDRLKPLQIENEAGECVMPSAEATQDGSYNPLGRQLFIYPSGEALQRPEVQAFMQFYLDNVNSVAERAGFIPLTDEQLTEAREKVEALAG